MNIDVVGRCVILAALVAVVAGCSGVENKRAVPIQSAEVLAEQGLEDAGLGVAPREEKVEESPGNSGAGDEGSADSGVETTTATEVSTTEIDDFGKIAAKGPIGSDIIALVVRGNTGMVRRCFEDRLEKPGTPVRLKVRVKVTPDGTVGSAVVVKAPGGSKAKECVVGALEHWTFPADGKSGTSFTLPVVFSVEQVRETVVVPVGPAPRIRASHSSGCCSDGLSKEVLRRIIRRKAGEVEYCRRLDPKKTGKVTVKFVVEGSGKVARAAVAKSTLGSAQVENCLASSMRRWAFPTPTGGGMVITSYDFEI